MPADQLRVVVSGVELTGWTGATITMGIDVVADAFSVSVPFDKASAEMARVLKPFGYQPIDLYLGPDIIGRGLIDEIETTLEESGRILTVQGRSKTGQLVDCSIDGPLEYVGLTLGGIARQVARPFGVGVRADADTDLIDIARASYGQSPIDFLNGIARPRNLYFGSSFDGQLVIWAGSSLESAPLRATLEEGVAPVLSVSARFAGTDRFSVYKAATQFAGEPDLVGVARDSGVSVFRPHLSEVSDADADPDATARKLRSESIAKSVTVGVSLAGWRRPDGALWSERQIVTLKAPGVLLPNAVRYVVAEVTHSLEAGRKTTALRLAPTAAYSGATIGASPWA